MDITLTVTPATVVAGAGTATLTADLAGALEQDVQLTVDAQQTPATGDPAYELSDSTITIAAGQTESFVTVTPLALPDGVDTVQVVFRVSRVVQGDCFWDVDIPAGPLTITVPGGGDGNGGGDGDGNGGGDGDGNGGDGDGDGTGCLQVILAPDEAIAAGAQWTADGGSGQDSGAIVCNLAPGTHTVDYSPVACWAAPATEDVTIVAGQTTQIVRTYTESPGGISVTLGPPAAVAAGAQWNVDGGPWQDSGVTVQLDDGTYTVRFREIDGWTAPPPEDVTVTGCEVTTIHRQYDELPK